MRQLLGVCLILLFTAGLANSQLYRNRFEPGDTLVSNTPDTTDKCLLYNTSIDNPRPIRSTVYILLTEIGINSTHYWLQIDVDIADRALAKDGNGWARIHTHKLSDWEGHAASSQNDLVISMPYLESYAGSYFRLVLTYLNGTAIDSTAYELVYTADVSGNMYSPPLTNYKVITHDMLFRTTDSKRILGTASIKTDYTDFRIETAPGVFRLPDRGYVLARGGTKTDDDSLTIYITSNLYGTTTGNLDTLTITLDGACAFSINLDEGSGFLESSLLECCNENKDSEDTTDFYLEVHLECDP